MYTRKPNVDAAVTISDVARESQVSIATVSHVINNGPQNVHPRTRERVLAVIDKLNYRPNPMARGLMRRRMNTIGVLAGGFSTDSVFANPYATGIMQGVLSGASKLKQDVLLFVEPWTDLRRSGPIFRDRRADGILSISPNMDSDEVSGLVSLGIVVVAVSADCLHLGVPSVDVDNAIGAGLAADHLVSLGHRRIGLVTGEMNLVSAAQRHDAFLDRLKHQGVQSRDEYVRHASYEGAGGPEAFLQMMRLPNPPTAIFASNDTLAVEMLYAARDAGIRVPETVSIMGFDDAPMFHHLTPALSTIHQPLDRIGETATRLLVERVSGDESEIVNHLVPPILVVRASTAAPARS